MAPNSEVVLIASRSKERAVEWASSHGVGKGVDYDGLDLSEVDAVYVPLPSGVRNEWLLKLANAGKHIYSEKPPPKPQNPRAI